MAIFRLRVNVVSRARGQSVLASAAYRAGERLHDPNRLRDHDYTRRHGVEHTEIMVPDHAPAWVQATSKAQEHEVRQRLWQRVEETERKKNSQLAREVVIALPHELDAHQRKQLVREFVERNFTSKGMVADVSLHRPGPRDHPKNFHAHILLTMRELAPDGFARHKQRAWNAHDLTQRWREDWARTANRHLERAGSLERIDHRSNEARGIDREPQPKLGPIAHEIEKSGRTSEAGNAIRAVKERNLLREIRALGIEAIGHLEKTAEAAQHPLAKEHALARLERVLDDLAERAPELGGPGRLSAPERDRQATAARAERGLGRAPLAALDLAAGVLAFFDPDPAPRPPPQESIEERIARLEAVRDQLLHADYARARAAGRAQELAREEEDDRIRGRERDRFK
jgi:hypothetical protein